MRLLQQSEEFKMFVRYSRSRDALRFGTAISDVLVFLSLGGLL